MIAGFFACLTLSLQKCFTIQGGTKVGIQLFVWKIIKELINHNTRINCVSCTHHCKPPFAPSCIFVSKLAITFSECPFKQWTNADTSKTAFVFFSPFLFVCMFLLLFKHSCLHFPPIRPYLPPSILPTSYLPLSILLPIVFVHGSFIHVP